MKKYLPVAVLAMSLIFTQFLQAQTKPFPNELKGFELYGRGKIATLSLGVSSKEEVVKIFGSDCTTKCDFDEKWQIEISYFGEFRQWRGEKEMTPKPEYVGKIYSITFMPKIRIPVKENKFSNKFIKSGVGAGASHSKRTFVYDLYYDENGLSYTIFDKIEWNPGSTKTPETNPNKKGDLVVIGYEISEKEEKQMWLEKVTTGEN